MTFSSKLRSGLTAAVCLLAPLLGVAQQWRGDKHDHLRSFEVPESKATYPLSINEAGTITGYYISKSGATSGFMRYAEGHIITFDVPESVLTEPVSINTAGDIAGYYQLATANGLIPGEPEAFVRSADGKITTFAGTLNGVQPVSINVAGEIVGNFADFTNAPNVFISSATGVITTFTLSLGSLYPTVATGLNASGAIVGYDSSQGIDIAQGFLFDGQGAPPNPFSGYTEISVSGSTGTFPTAINAEQTVVGCYTVGTVYHDFVRDSDGTIETLDIPGTIPACVATLSFPVMSFNVVPQSVTVNDLGTITGYYTNASKVSRGFVRFADGKLATFEHRGSTQTIPTSINNGDVITGYYSRGTEILGFIREPGKDF